MTADSAPMDSVSADANFEAFLPGTGLPRRRPSLADPQLGEASRALVEALFDRDRDRVDRLLSADRALAQMPVGEQHDMLIVAIATAEPALVSMLLRNQAPPDGRVAGLPLELAIRAIDPTIAYQLLEAGARPHPPSRPTAPLRMAITINSLGAVRMLIDFGADPNVMEETGTRPLQTALHMEHFRIAECLLDAGADPWAIDIGGSTLGASVTAAMLTVAPEEAAAQSRLAARLETLGWPEPAPSPAQVRLLATSGAWPPRGIHADPVPAFVLEKIAETATQESNIH